MKISEFKNIVQHLKYIVFELPDKSRMPTHRFGHGDIVLISRTRPWGEKVYEGIVLDRGPTRIRIVVTEKINQNFSGYKNLSESFARISNFCS